jgi:hypothetical protein
MNDYYVNNEEVTRRQHAMAFSTRRVDTYVYDRC